MNLKTNALNKLLTILFFLNLSSISQEIPGQNPICAEVKIEIEQELTLERQAFDAYMRIYNGFKDLAIHGIGVEVFFTDRDGQPVLATSEPNHPSALFFIRPDTMTGISGGTEGAGRVEPTTTADLHWLIIPAPGAGDAIAEGTLYYVGARLTYTLDGEETVTEVVPDFIVVKPLPDLVLDYFLPHEVYGDNALTTQIEPIVSFPLGARVQNSGFGIAKNLKNESSQLKIVENELGLLIGFNIEGCEVNGQPHEPTLLADFGDIAPNSSGLARWLMTCTLLGRFVDFGATFTHADELGGALTSLIEIVNTHLLIHVVEPEQEKQTMDGKITKYYDNGKIRNVTEYKNGVRSGISEQWHCNGIKIEHGVYSDGKLNGVLLQWYEDGSLFSKTDYLMGEKCGSEEIYSSKGYCIVKRVWKCGKLLEEHYWDFNGVEIIFPEDALEEGENGVGFVKITNHQSFKFEFECDQFFTMLYYEAIFYKNGTIGQLKLKHGFRNILGFNEYLLSYLRSQTFEPATKKGAPVTVVVKRGILRSPHPE
ncbi:MAG: hypothetical protein CR997_12955 [Acidobacteria bacterium]|nr:MAG: hypothetical protein CR997_12955 [Acidobacteriota bacterium]